MIFLFNIGVTSAAVLFEMSQSNVRSSIVIDTSVGITFILFVAILFYHAQKQMFLTRFGIQIKAKLSQLFRCRERDEDVDIAIPLAT